MIFLSLVKNNGTTDNKSNPETNIKRKWNDINVINNAPTIGPAADERIAIIEINEISEASLFLSESFENSRLNPA